MRGRRIRLRTITRALFPRRRGGLAPLPAAEQKRI
jgi:hypothetical protein